MAAGRKGKEEAHHNNKKRKEKAGSPQPPHSPNPILFPAWADPPSSAASTSASPESPSPWTAVASAPGALRSLRGGGGVFHPLESWRADFLAVQASARDPWGSRN